VPIREQEAGLFLERGELSAFAFLVVREAYVRLRGRQGPGLGDVKLAAVAGAWLSWLMVGRDFDSGSRPTFFVEYGPCPRQ
jgi:hypothetical protein